MKENKHTEKNETFDFSGSFKSCKKDFDKAWRNISKMKTTYIAGMTKMCK